MRHFQKPDDFNAFNAFKSFNAFKKQWLSTLPTLAAILLLVLTGCGHNIVTYGDGIGFETTFRPDSGNFGFVLRYGKVLSATVRENTLVEMVGEGKGGAEGSASGSASASGSVTIKTDSQTTGYTVDAIRAKAEAIKPDPAK